MVTNTPEGKRAPAEASSPKPTPTGLGLSTLPPVTPGLPIVVVKRSPQPTPAHGLPKLQDTRDIEAVTEVRLVCLQGGVREAYGGLGFVKSVLMTGVQLVERPGHSLAEGLLAIDNPPIVGRK